MQDCDIGGEHRFANVRRLPLLEAGLGAGIKRCNLLPNA